jgi:hypothetical protein
MRCYDEYTVHGGAENLHNVVHVKRWTRALLSPASKRDNNRARPVHQYCAVSISLHCAHQRWIEDALNLFHHHDLFQMCDLFSSYQIINFKTNLKL